VTLEIGVTARARLCIGRTLVPV